MNKRCPTCRREKLIDQFNKCASKKDNYPKNDFRILCWNCNCSRGFSGYCPHALKEAKG